MYEFFSTAPYKTFKIEIQFFCNKVPITPPKSVVLLLLHKCICAKNVQRHKKLKKEGQIWKQNYQVSLERMSTFGRKLLQKLIFPKFAFFDVSAGQNTTLSYPKELFSYSNLFDSCLIMKNWNPRKWLTLSKVYAGESMARREWLAISFRRQKTKPQHVPPDSTPAKISAHLILSLC